MFNNVTKSSGLGVRTAKCVRLMLQERNVTAGLSTPLQLTVLYLHLFEILKYILLIHKTRRLMQ
jgi:hypothetical protein